MTDKSIIPPSQEIHDITGDTYVVDEETNSGDVGEEINNDDVEEVVPSPSIIIGSRRGLSSIVAKKRRASTSFVIQEVVTKIDGSNIKEAC
jgi:hypothetical protein